MPLSIAPYNEILKIVKIMGEKKDKLHFNNLGLIEGAEVMIISRNGKSIILKLNDIRFAIDGNFCSKIIVNPVR